MIDAAKKGSFAYRDITGEWLESWPPQQPGQPPPPRIGYTLALVRAIQGGLPPEASAFLQRATRFIPSKVENYKGIENAASFRDHLTRSQIPLDFDDHLRSFKSGQRERNPRVTGSICDALMAETNPGYEHSISFADRDFDPMAVEDTRGPRFPAALVDASTRCARSARTISSDTCRA